MRRFLAVVGAAIAFLLASPAAVPAHATDNYGISVNIADGLCLDIPNSNAYNGQVVQQYWCNGTNAQKWNVFIFGSAYFKVQSTAWPQFCLNNWSGSGAEGGYIKLYSCDSADSLFNTVGPNPDVYQQFQPKAAYLNCSNMWGGQAVGNVMRLYPCEGREPNSMFRLYMPTGG